MTYVIDASVSVKWIIRDPAIESDVDKAVAVMRAVRFRRIIGLVPPIWLPECMAVIARLRPHRAMLALTLYQALPLETTSSVMIFHRATQLAIDLKQHLFDTLYHAVALEHGATLVTADHRYFAAARGQGQVILLNDLDLAA